MSAIKERFIQLLVVVLIAIIVVGVTAAVYNYVTVESEVISSQPFDVQNLGVLLDLTTTAQCCKAATETNFSARYLYNPPTDSTYTTTCTNANTACAGKVGAALQMCIDEIDAGEGCNPVARYNATPYFLFRSNQDTAVCDTFGTCP